ncbi:Predicted arabinose efflux permease, MFS family [Raineyella antarctica]|uniref:Predicted arabinose efflux permease, MFS family n=1 Tax=Raineyella antarctica TaxID=1577474 RepID=A0A1G6H802_9ACTN|nr:MFS transporter [Raineyella antarctica]SDB90218.1 Predicted arabinose efflux permease, MFS family [Raineyella antarctica]
MSPTSGRQQPRLWPLFAGGFLGPFGGAVTNTMLPELATGLGSDLQTAASAVTWYMLPFCAALLFSGSLAQRWGRGRTIRGGFAVYLAASLVCIFAALLPSVAVVPAFMAGRALQGIGNAFTTPVLVSLLAEFVPREKLGASLGMFAAMQAAGQAFSPLVGGVSADVDYRLAFVVTGLAALVLAVVTPTGRAGSTTGPTNWRALANPRLVQSSLVGFAAQVTATGVTVLAALIATDRFGLSPTVRGLVVAFYGVAGLFSGKLAGRLSDRFGIRTMGVASLLVLGASMALVGLAPWVVLLLLLVGLIGATGTAGRILTNTLALRSTPENTGGATSFTMAVQFLGSAIVPALLPLYAVSPATATVAAGSVTVLGGLVALVPVKPARASET